MTNPMMPPEVAEWIRDEVLGAYHWAVWTGDWRTGTPANERNPECQPDYTPDEPDPASVHFCERMGALVGPGRRRGDQSKSSPVRKYEVYLAQAVQAAGLPPFTVERAAWIRAHAWTAGMREIDASYPGGRGCFLYRISPCEMRRCGACDSGRCDRCIAREQDGLALDFEQTVREDRSAALSALSRWPSRWDAAVTLDGRTVAHLYAVENQRCAGWVCTCDCRRAEPADTGEGEVAGPHAAPRPRARRRDEQRARPASELVQDALFPALFPVGDAT
ncbi:DUF6248 family natural product biosynthesis protein [Actinomadura sp. NPDC023710]|uniref:DUF6248 family natural product biosynthesis protein n=1 Tax=Actinomadura sp. NPDC023710 TaxID=3158219 RepID=UPI0033ECA331